MPEANKHYFRLLLADRNQYPERTEAIDREILDTFERKVAVLVLDMGGFSRLTIEFGIIHFLAMISQMCDTARPIISRHHGTEIKQEADNLFVMFPTAEDALLAALDLRQAFDSLNHLLPDGRHLYACFGIGYGDLLVIDNEDMFGTEMNIACKLGEDLAQNSDILLTVAAHANLPTGKYPTTQAHYAASGIDIECFRYAP